MVQVVRVLGEGSGFWVSGVSGFPRPQGSLRGSLRALVADHMKSFELLRVR